MAKVIGIGGIFFKFNDPEAIQKWYREVLGMTLNDYGVLFEFNHRSSPKNYLQLGTFEENTTYFGDKSQRAMINFRVDDLVELQKQLIENKVEILNEIEEYSYGKFLHINDPEGNRIELWQPVDSEFERDRTSIMPMN